MQRVAVSSHQWSELSQAWRRFRANRLAVAGAVYIILLCLMAILADALAPHDPAYIFRGMRGVGSSWEHPLGFDHVGRCLLSRIIFGARVSLIVGLSTTLLTVVIGVMIGAAAGYVGGWGDAVLSRIADTLMALPLFVLLVMLAAMIGPGLHTTIVIIGVTGWTRIARVVRAEALSLKERDFVMAARAVGGGGPWIIWRHILPNVLPAVIVLATLGVGMIIILEATLSFFGLGVRPPTPSWGGTLADGRAFILMFPHISIAPGIMIVLIVLAFNFFGNGLRDALDPHQKKT
ncbi:MAG: Glutathione transport system permease protein GsiD [Firmicutes bacterium]|nr:Glutathione transport system permease protein GsiD [Bacillota bacterium]